MDFGRPRLVSEGDRILLPTLGVYDLFSAGSSRGIGLVIDTFFFGAGDIYELPLMGRKVFPGK